MPAHPVTVAAYLVDAADTRTETGERAYAVATFGTWIAAINHQHRTTGHLSPSAHELVTATLSGIRREYAAAGDRPRTPRDPLLVDDIKILVSTARSRCRGWADEVLERRDSAILLLGFAGAYRRSELSEMVCGDVTVHRHDGLHVRLRKSKTDQEGRGAVKALPYTESHETCPPCAYVRWAQVVAAFDVGGRPSVIRLLRKREPFNAHVCRGGVPRTAARAPLFRAIAKNGNLGATHCPVPRSTRPSAAAPNTPATTPPPSPSSADTRSGPDSSPKAPATAPTDPPSPARPATPASTPSRCTAANTRHSLGTQLTTLGCSRPTSCSIWTFGRDATESNRRRGRHAR